MEDTTVNRLAAVLNERLMIFTLSNKTVQVLVIWAFEAKVAAADIIDGLIVNHEGAVGVFQGGVGSENGIVRLDNRGSRLRSRIDTKFQLALLAIVYRETLHEKSTKARACAASKGVKDQETLETDTVVGNASNLVKNSIDQLLANSIVTTSIVVRRILLSADHHLRVEEVSVGASADLIDDVWLEIAVDSTGNIFALT